MIPDTYYLIPKVYLLSTNYYLLTTICSLPSMRLLLSSIILSTAAFSAKAAADSTISGNRFNLHFQVTYIYQYSARLKSPYSGSNSLSGDEEKQNSLTTTLYLGARLWKGASVYVNPEVAGGSGLSGAQGMGGSSNGETYRVGDPAPTLYLGRAYLNQNFALSKEGDYTSDDANIISEFVPKNRLSLMLGKFSLGDLFDNNNVSNSP
ncbi:MAG: carbohydrate porin, partial [Chitinophagaceae bacterium]